MQTSLNQLTSYISDLSHLFNELEDTLNREKEAIDNRNNDLLNNLTEGKYLLLQSVERTHQQYSAFLTRLEINDPKKDITRFLIKINSDDAKKTYKQWKSLSLLIKKCNQQNDLNGKIVGTRLSQFHHLLDIIKGKTEDAVLYDTKGTKKDSQHQQTIAKA